MTFFVILSFYTEMGENISGLKILPQHFQWPVETFRKISKYETSSNLC